MSMRPPIPLQGAHAALLPLCVTACLTRSAGAPAEPWRVDPPGDAAVRIDAPIARTDGSIGVPDSHDVVSRDAPQTGDLASPDIAPTLFESGWDPRPGAALDRPASSIFVDDREGVLVGGSFRRVGGQPGNLLARFDPTSGALRPVANSLSGRFPGVNVISRWRDTVVLGGSFSGGLAFQVGDDFLPRAGALQEPGFVFALVPEANRLWVGGNFVTPTHDAAHLATWDGSGWQETAGALDPVVMVAARDGDTLWVGGDLVTSVNVPSMDLVGVGRYDLRARRWMSIGEGLTGGGLVGGRSSVNAIAVTPDFVYVGGDFLTIGGVGARGIARWRRATARWERLPGGDVRGAVQALVVAGERLYAGGIFSEIGGVAAANVAVFDLTREQWSALGGGVEGTVNNTLPTQVVDIAVSGRDVYFAGDFSTAGGVPAMGFAHYRHP